MTNTTGAAAVAKSDDERSGRVTKRLDIIIYGEQLFNFFYFSACLPNETETEPQLLADNTTRRVGVAWLFSRRHSFGWIRQQKVA